MVTRITNIAPLKLAVFAGILYALLGIIIALLFVPMMAMMAAFGGHVSPGFGMGMGAIVVLPLMYGVLGFIGGLVTAAIYNLVAGWTGGVELTLHNVVPAYSTEVSTTA
ncbi:MAG: hypothetical protein M3M96_06590 [Candidatus Eremiobacteraeota bacterium]|nr:hypothetical protein [Candidatus Eremiobacteraeota bacterium]